jgi:hypothetical protein
MKIKAQLSILIQLANVDNDFSDEERDMIFMVGKANGVEEKEIDKLMDQPEKITSVQTMSEDEKFEMLFNLVQLMKVDKEIFLSEVKYCEEVAEKLNFKKAVIAELSSKIYSDPSITSDKESLKRAIIKYQS